MGKSAEAALRARQAARRAQPGPQKVSRAHAGMMVGSLARARDQAAAGDPIAAQATLVAAGIAGQSAGLTGGTDLPGLVRQPGGDVLNQLLHPSAFRGFERLYRRLPEQSIHQPSLDQRNRSLTLSMGSYTVPKGMSLWLLNFDTGVLVFDGVNPNDFRPAEDGRFTGVLGYDLVVNGSRRNGDLQYDLDPLPVATDRPEYDPQPGGRTSARAFDEQAARNFATNAPSGRMTMPVRQGVTGPRGDSPYTWVLNGGDRLGVRLVVYRRVTQPVAGFQARVGGFLLQKVFSDSLIQRVRPQ